MKNLKKRKIVVVILGVIILSSKATNTWIVNLNSGISGMYGQANIRTVIFRSGKMVVKTKDDTELAYLIEEIQNVVLLKTPDNVLPYPTVDSESTIFPCPVQSELNIRLSEPVSSAVCIRIMGMDGKVWLQERYPAECRSSCFTISVSELPKGIYFCQLHSGDNRLVKKFVK